MGSSASNIQTPKEKEIETKIQDKIEDKKERKKIWNAQKEIFGPLIQEGKRKYAEFIADMIGEKDVDLVDTVETKMNYNVFQSFPILDKLYFKPMFEKYNKQNK